MWLAIASTAIGNGRCAAQAIDFKLRGIEPPVKTKSPVIKEDKLRTGYYEKLERAETESLPIEERLADMIAEVNQGLSREEAMKEAERCMSCGYCFSCEQCYLMCQEGAIKKPADPAGAFTFDLGKCTSCDKCVDVCPCGYIEMV